MIVDTHVHFYDPRRPQGVPFPSQDDELLYRHVLPEEFVKVGSRVEVHKTVVVEASRRVEDNDWVLDLASSHHCIVGFIGGLDPRSLDFESHLRRLSQNPIFRGIRLRQDEFKNWSSVILENLNLLVELGLSLDVLAHAEDLELILHIADTYPNLPIIVNHLCHLEIDGASPSAQQHELLKVLGARSNVYFKVSALQQRVREGSDFLDETIYQPMFDLLWNIFGERRLIYGSNWPVCEREASYETQFQMMSSYFSSKGKMAYEQFFCENSKNAYRYAL